MNSLSMGALSSVRFNEALTALFGVEVVSESSELPRIVFKFLKDLSIRGIMSRNIAIAICTPIVVLAMSQVAAAQGIPVIPGAAGFGITTPAGRGGQIYRVTNLNDSGAGSLRACAEGSGPRTCIFEVSGAIWLSKGLKITNPNLTIAGQTAPSPGIELRNFALVIKASDVLIQHIRVRVGDDPSGANYENRDTLMIEGPGGKLTQNVVVDHSSFSWSTDETATTYSEWDNITLSHNIFSDALHDSFHPDTAPPGNGKGHSKGVLLNDSTGLGRVSMVGNIIAHIVDRNPRTKTSDVVFVNNIVYNAKSTNATINRNAGTTDASLVGNIFLDGPDSDRWKKSIRLQSLYEGSRIYIHDNIAPELNGTDQWAMVSKDTPVSRQSLEVFSPPTWPAGLVARPTANNNAYDWVLSNAGARPAERDTVDTRAVNDIRNRTGEYKNCVSDDGSDRCSRNAGGWPQLAENHRPLVLPNNPNADDDGDGYTNLEEMLHQMASDLESSEGSLPAVAKPNPPSNLDISK